MINRRIYFIILLFFTNQLFSQLVYDQWDDIIPFSLTEKYKDSINVENIHSLVLPSFNNDSLCKLHNNGKSLSEIGASCAIGFNIDTSDVSIFESGTKFKIKEGYLWIYTIESKSARELIAVIEKFTIPDGAYLSLYDAHKTNVIKDPETYTSSENEMIKKDNGITELSFGGKMVIEFFQPISCSSTPKIILKEIGYNFLSLINKTNYHE
ncbi:MAG: hypothetical protein JEZ09_19115 [Salinivirgaceae bacterium]|nr:hypothetical protein [Salinivirgaceae bacterium]